MSGFLLYQPTDKPSPRETPALDGLDRQGDGQLRAVIDRKGPDAGSGTLWYCHDEARKASWPVLEYRPTTQTWIKAPQGAWWLGWETDKRPTPDDLNRSVNTVAGFYARLNDGCRWVIPNGPMLPIDFSLGDDGQLVEVVKTAWRSTYEKTVKAFDLATSLMDRDDPIDATNRDEIAAYCGELLAINYRLTPAVATLLGLWDPESLWRALLLSTDAVRINALIDSKKNTATGGG